jgi:hypothetical protein
MDNFIICVVSTQRAENVPAIKKHFPNRELVFFVSKNEGTSYKMFGATNVIECDRNICDARNKAFLYCKEQNKYCVQTSDDLKGISVVINKKKHKITTIEAINDIINKMCETGAKICGVAITDNILNYKEDWRYDKLIVNDLIVIAPDNELLYDNGAFLKEDYDMFILQMKRYGIVLRADKYLCRFPHRENKGGGNTYRTYDTEKKQNDYVIEKHSGLIIPHNRRENQISVNYKKLYEDISVPSNK